jgi:protein-disulfide isomerase
MRIAAALVSIGIALAGQTLFAGHADVVEGNPDSTVKVLIYEDLQSSDCARLQAILDQKILPRYGSKIAIVRRDFPLGKHDWARQAAVAARWVYEQSNELGIEFRREILAEQDSITVRNLNSWLLEFASRNRLDQKSIVDAQNDRRINTLVDQDHQTGAARGVSQMPTVYIDGRAFTGTIIYEDLARALDEALAK